MSCILGALRILVVRGSIIRHFRRRDADLCNAYPDRTFWSVSRDDVTLSLHPLELSGMNKHANPPGRN